MPINACVAQLYKASDTPEYSSGPLKYVLK